MTVVLLEYSNFDPGSASSGCSSAQRAMSSRPSRKSILTSLDSVGTGPASVWSSPDRICKRCRKVISLRGSPGRCQPGTGAGSSSLSRPSATSIPIITAVIVFAIDQLTKRVSAS